MHHFTYHLFSSLSSSFLLLFSSEASCSPFRLSSSFSPFFLLLLIGFPSNWWCAPNRTFFCYHWSGEHYRNVISEWRLVVNKHKISCHIEKCSSTTSGSGAWRLSLSCSGGPSRGCCSILILYVYSSLRNVGTAGSTRQLYWALCRWGNKRERLVWRETM